MATEVVQKLLRPDTEDAVAAQTLGAVQAVVVAGQRVHLRGTRGGGRTRTRGSLVHLHCGGARSLCVAHSLPGAVTHMRALRRSLGVSHMPWRTALDARCSGTVLWMP